MGQILLFCMIHYASLFFVFAMVIVLAPSLVYADTFENADFTIKHPDGWSAIKPDLWNSTHSVTFAPSSTKTTTTATILDTFITVSLYDTYFAANMPGDTQTITIEQIDLDVINTIAHDAEQRCRMNLDGHCWGFKLLDSKIITISHERAAQIDFSAHMNNADVLVRIIVLPSDSGIWVVKGMSVIHDDDFVVAQPVIDATSTFNLIKFNTVTKPNILQKPVQWEPDDPDLVLQKTIQINMIMVGQKWSPLDTARILEEMPSYHDPVFTTIGDRVGVRYHYDYNFVSDVDNTEEILRIMDENSKKHPILGSGIIEDYMFWHAAWLERHPHLQDKKYRLVDALAVEEYLQDVIIGSNPDLVLDGSFTANFVFLNIEPTETKHIQNYYISTTDRATDKNVDYVGLMGFGSSTSNTFFFDMWALPWEDQVLDDFFYLPSYMENLHDCHEPNCIAKIVSTHTDSAIYHILTPSFLYPVEFFDSYFLDVLLYLTPGGRITVTHSVLDDFMNQDELVREMEYLYPFAKWDISLSVERKDLRGMSYEFKTQFENLKRERIVYGDQTIVNAYLNSSKITPYLIEWAQQRQHDRLSVVSNDTWTVPMLIVVDNTDAEVLLDNGAIGIASGMPDDESLPCCALAVTDATDVWENRIGLDNLMLHELGHVMGLHHPFLSFKYSEPTPNFYFNWYSSPMTYSFPDGWIACGLLYYWFYASPCGNAAASFTVFERERLSDVRVVSLLQKIGVESEDLSEDVAAVIQSNVTEIKKTFASGDTLSETGALHTALELYDAVKYAVISGNTTAIITTAVDVDDNDDVMVDDVMVDDVLPDMAVEIESGVFAHDGDDGDALMTNETSKDNSTFSDVPVGSKTPLLDDHNNDVSSDDATSIDDMINSTDNNSTTSNLITDTPTHTPKQDVIPAWVKNSAGWWADGLIDDLEFISSIEYMIEHDIIIVDVSNAVRTDDAQQKLPAWVKNSAGWWADGLLADNEFVESIKYMISVGIIQV